jgi:hypothetical protein
MLLLVILTLVEELFVMIHLLVEIIIIHDINGFLLQMILMLLNLEIFLVKNIDIGVVLGQIIKIKTQFIIVQMIDMLQAFNVMILQII